MKHVFNFPSQTPFRQNGVATFHLSSSIKSGRRAHGSDKAYEASQEKAIPSDEKTINEMERAGIMHVTLRYASVAYQHSCKKNPTTNKTSCVALYFLDSRGYI